MKAKKSKGTPAAKRASKDLAARKSQDVKGGGFRLGDIIGSVIKTVPTMIDSMPIQPAQPVKPAK
jgi:hypothetical protein